ncbi:hypothetical protein [Curtobacterium sp. VKM Ac-1376]|uniref:hypothetical protein n=1 Tax=Curtobacterium sp. VKM Ac-1376 TaxID=123312 RepID=UPI00188A0437|nr:hypothetical protein [Curtobacterium sp. VKM Ac-1376]MBF4616419.1 hypothetical protein [Curtobacterium sp. VKM Ac-1376]
MTVERVRPGDPELAMIETLETAIREPGHTFNDLDPNIEAFIEQHLFGEAEGKTLDGGFSIRIKPMGRSAVQRFRSRQVDAVARKRALPDLYLRYVWERCNAGSDAYPDKFLETEPHWCGDVYTAAELERAGTWLLERELIDGVKMANSDAPIRAKITADGEDVIEGGRSVHDPAPSARGSSHFMTSIHGGNVQIAQQSSHVTQSQDNRSGAAAALELVDAVLAQVSELPAAQQVSVNSAAEELRGEAEGHARESVLQQLGNKVFTAAVVAGATAGSNTIAAQLMPHLAKLLHAIGVG